ncbi:MAG: DMT family transporter [Roseibium sp.]|uniref:DMT family transporter n=1 Tax=Roseibium sp. TaxID=1936156 RepID=UPI001B01324E|nr:DMT family transporter [Roseibium sp.]MBO6891278.1 DMT family transporter [Roseibium sp.]MBO6931491.1 DMT family transporter [Roseibium sp.]
MSTVTTGTQSQTTSGIVLMCVGVSFLAINDAFAKALTDHYSPVQILFLRNFIALPFVFLVTLKIGGPSALVSRRPVAHLARGIIWIAAATLFFTSLKFLELAEATALVFAAPVFVTALSALVLGERVRWRRWLAVLGGFLGVLIVVRPGADTFQLASLLPVATAVLYAVMMISARWVDPKESVWTLSFYMVSVGLFLSLVFVPFVWVMPKNEHIWLFLGIAATGTAGVTMITQAFRFAPASIVAPLDYTALIWATLLGRLIWSETPDFATFFGAAIIIASGLFIILRERQAAT